MLTSNSLKNGCKKTESLVGFSLQVYEFLQLYNHDKPTKFVLTENAI